MLFEAQMCCFSLTSGSDVVLIEQRSEGAEPRCGTAGVSVNNRK